MTTEVHTCCRAGCCAAVSSVNDLAFPTWVPGAIFYQGHCVKGTGQGGIRDPPKGQNTVLGLRKIRLFTTQQWNCLLGAEVIIHLCWQHDDVRYPQNCGLAKDQPLSSQSWLQWASNLLLGQDVTGLWHCVSLHRNLLGRLSSLCLMNKYIMWSLLVKCWHSLTSFSLPFLYKPSQASLAGFHRVLSVTAPLIQRI